MGKPRTKKSRSTRTRARGPEDSELDSAVSLVDRFVDALAIRAEQTAERANEAREGTRSRARALLRSQESWADLEAARRLRDEVTAAASIAEARVAAVEAEAAEAMQSAFGQFTTARAWRRGAAKLARLSSGARSRRRGPDDTMQALGEMAAKAMIAVAHVIIDRERLARGLAEVRVKLEELKQAACYPETGAAARAQTNQLVLVCESHAAYLGEQLLSHTRVAERLKGELRKLFAVLPEPAAEAASLRIRAEQGPDCN
jgi:hypothetical protein